MRKIAILFLVLMALAQATTYYAQNGSGSIATREWDPTPTGGGTDLVWANLADGDVLVANGQTDIDIDVNVGDATHHVTLTTAAYSGTAGGGFTVGSQSVSVYAHVTGGTTACLSNIAGTTTINIIGDITAGTSNAAFGLQKTVVSTQTYNITGDIRPGNSVNSGRYGIHITTTNTTINITGDVYGSDYGPNPGINCTTISPTITVTGNIINGKYPAIVGPCIYTPAATNYIRYPGSGSTTKNYYYDIPDAANVRNNDTVAGVTGTLDLALYVLKSAVVAARYVILGHDNYTGGDAGAFIVPAVSDVKSGVEYGYSAEFTGEYVGTGGGGGLRGGANKRGGKQ